MPNVGTIAVNFTARTAQFSKGTRQVNQRLKNMKAQTSKTGSGLKSFAVKMAAVVVAALSARAAFAALRRSMAELDNIGKTSDKLGIAAEKLQGLRLGAELSGVGMDKMQMAVQRMTRRVAEAALGTGEAKDAIKELGLDAGQLAAMSPDQALAAVAEALSKVENQGHRVRLAFKLFDSEGVAMVNMLRDGEKGLSGFQAEAERLGAAVSRVDIAKVEMANDAFTKLKFAIGAAVQRIAVALAPWMEKIANWLGDLVASNRLEGMINKFSRFIIGAVGNVANAANQMVANVMEAGLQVTDFVAGIYESTAQVGANFGFTEESRALAGAAAQMRAEIEASRKVIDGLREFDTKDALLGGYDKMLADFNQRAEEHVSGALVGIGNEMADTIGDSAKEAQQRLTVGAMGAGSGEALSTIRKAMEQQFGGRTKSEKEREWRALNGIKRNSEQTVAELTQLNRNLTFAPAGVT